MKRMMIAILMIALLIACVSCVTTKKETKNSTQIEKSKIITKQSDYLGVNKKSDTQYDHSIENAYLISPFQGISYKVAYHVIAFFEGHETYECVEAFIYTMKNKDDTHAFRAIMTKHDNTQEDYFNSEVLYNTRKKTKTRITRPANLTEGIFRVDKEKDYILTFKLKSGEEIAIVYIGMDKPTSQYAGMTDPGGHSPNGGLPIMFRDTSSIGTEHSYVRIDKIKYKIAIDKAISKPPFFIGYATFFSIGYSMMILPTFKEMNIPLNKYAFNESQNLSYNIISDHLKEEISFTKTTNGIAEIVSITCTSEFSPKGAYGRLTFNPPFPNIYAMKQGTQTTVRFATSFDTSGPEEVYGDITIKKMTADTATLFLTPKYPGWAKDKRAMRYTISITDDNVVISTTMNYN
jgi:hypothetical protein